MPDITQLLDAKFCRSSFQDPIVELDGWRLFMDGGFRPSARNMNLVARVLGWNKEIPRYYVSLVGFEESGCYEYQKGCELPVLGPCAVGSLIVRLPREEMISAVRCEVNKALARPPRNPYRSRFSACLMRFAPRKALRMAAIIVAY